MNKKIRKEKTKELKFKFFKLEINLSVFKKIIFNIKIQNKIKK